MTLLQSAFVITASLLSLAVAGGSPASAQQNPAQKSAQAFPICKREAETKAPVAGAAPSDQLTMNHYLEFADCMQRYGYAVADNAAANHEIDRKPRGA